MANDVMAADSSAVDDHEADVRAKILHILSIYPKLGWSHLQVSIGTALPPASWKPIVQRMIDNGELVQSNDYYNAPNGRSQSYAVISKAPAPTQTMPVVQAVAPQVEAA